jgi:hypothetical protein
MSETNELENNSTSCIKSDNTETETEIGTGTVQAIEVL